MIITEQTIEATLDSDGHLRLQEQPQLLPGPVRVTIRAVAAIGPLRSLADVAREIAADQRSRGFQGRSAEDMQSEEDKLIAEEDERDRELNAARGGSTSEDS